MENFFYELGSFTLPDEFFVVFKGAFLFAVGCFSFVCIMAFIGYGIAGFVQWVRSRGARDD